MKYIICFEQQVMLEREVNYHIFFFHLSHDILWLSNSSIKIDIYCYFHKPNVQKSKEHNPGWFFSC